jgi:hypothetical protein
MNMNDFVRKAQSSSLLVIGLFVLALALSAGTGSLSAQTNPNGTVTAAGPSATDPASEQAKQAAQPATQPQAAPGEGFKLGAYDVRSEFEFGYRWNSGIRGNEQMYRSQVNLFSGAELLSSSLSLRSTPGTGLFDRMSLSMDNWGNPYNSMRFNIGRTDLYDLRASYRNVRYYNYISTLDNPLLGQGRLLPQHTLDLGYRMTNVDLRLFPNHKIVPFVGYSRNSAMGPGLTTLGTPGNEFVLNSNWVTLTDEFRGGVQFNLSRLNLTLEQGYRLSRNDSNATHIPGSQGNEGPDTSILGQPITLDSLNRSYSTRTKLPTSKILAKFSPFENLRMVGRYIYAMGQTDADMGEIRTGGFVNFDPIAYGAAADTFSGRVTRPNHNGSFLIEYSPIPRLTLTDNVDTVDYHVSGAGMLSTLYLNASSLLGPGPKKSLTLSEAYNTLFTYNEVRNEAGIELDFGHGISGLAGHRYSSVEIANDDSEDVTTAQMIRNTAIIGMVYRPGRWLRLGIDYENTQTNRPTMRNDLFAYDQFNLDWKLGAWKGLSFNGRIGIRDNKDTAPDIGLKGRDQTYSGSVNYELSERFNVSADFSRTNLFSDLLIVLPQKLTTTRQIFDQRVAGIGGRMGIGIYKGIKTEFGYRGVFNKGSFPIEFHQPFASLWIPIGKGLAFKPTWQYYGYHQDQFGFENYQTHLVTFAFVFAR